MPAFLTTIKTSAAIEDIIKHAKKRIVLISPYLKLSKQLYLRLNDAAKKNIQITVVYGKSDLRKEEEEQLRSINGLKLLYLQDLHAKCYFNEQYLIVTSMNMYEFSEKNNHEMGVLFSAIEDKEIYDEVIIEAASFVRYADGEYGKSLDNPASATIKNKQTNKVNTNRDKVKSKYSPKENVDSLFKIDSKYNEPCNFHFPCLYAALITDYPQINKSLRNIDYEPNLEIELNDFPIKGVAMIIKNSIKFCFTDGDYYRKLRSELKGTFENKVSKVSFYWNSKDLNVVPVSDESFSLNESGLKEKVGHYLHIIRVVSSEFKKQVKTIL